MTRFLLLALLTIAMVVPTATYAKDGRDYDDDSRIEDYDDEDEDEDEDEDDDYDDSDDRDHHRHGDDDDEDEEDEDDRDEDEDREDNSNDGLEVEADVFTDTTIVKVELENGRKTVFDTDADTREEVVDEVAERFNLTEAEVDDVLNFEIEDRASRAKDRARINGESHNDQVAIDEAVLRAYIVRLEALLEALLARLQNQ